VLSTLSTSAPAPSVRADPSVSRRGLAIGGIWTKSLAFATDAGRKLMGVAAQKKAALRARDSVRRASDFVQIPIARSVISCRQSTTSPIVMKDVCGRDR
jgi:hypothetical protein